ncbi:ESX secretion-associated protein EspG [Mycobacterium sp. M1]|uniref:ESX secretion-associated protein EspG n=1 Tax=Mycolicibacter acidiphilus TaxID=2835306 RepID=A0ABS5RKB8_9MYCO|nr:ESX secretion-associated protein EspG [Mycolicibacter acidiphilus]MBS9534748.1 ESX secretion-associated protein EspG [Mycolicibacter acidiphilus]
MPSVFSPGGAIDDVVGVEVTIDGMLVVADRMGLKDFPSCLGIWQNIPSAEVRQIVWGQVRRDLTEQGVLDGLGNPHPSVAAMVDTISGPDRTLEARWFRRTGTGSTLARFVVCRKGERHVLATRNGDLLSLQLLAPQMGLADMVTVALGPGEPAEVDPSTADAASVAACRTPEDLVRIGVPSTSAHTFAAIIAAPDSWVEITASERLPGGTFTRTRVAVGIADSRHGRLVSVPRYISGKLHGSFLSGTTESLQRALDGLVEFLPSKSW